MVEIEARRLPGGSRARETGAHVTKQLVLDPARAAFVLVDVWDWHYIPTFYERAQRIAKEKIVPALAAARRVGMEIIHAPSLAVAQESPDCRYRISPLVEVRPSDRLHYQGGLVRHLEHIDTVVYVGFAANRCLLKRPYGIVATAALGYRILVLRDATTGVEYPGTLDGLWATKAAICEIERHYGYTVLTEDFINACHTL